MDIKEAIALIEGANPSATPAKIRAGLLSLGISKEEAFKAFPAGERKSFKEDYYDWLIEDARSEYDAKTYIAEYGSDNVVKHASAHLLVWDLVQKVREEAA